MIRAITLTVLFSAIFIVANAQDVIIRRNGKVTECKILEVGINNVTYKLGKEESDASFVIRKNELSSIRMENGVTVYMNERQEAENEKNSRRGITFGANLINFSPFQALDSGIGFGINYERIIDKQGYFGITLPFALTFPDNSSSIAYDTRQGTEIFYFSPGLKIYPAGQRRVTYAVGPNLFTGFGHRWIYNDFYNPNTGSYTSTEARAKVFRFGLMVNNYINFQITRAFQLGLHLGLGSRYVDNEKYLNINNKMHGIEFTGEFMFNLGLRL
ncbi:hypothetical protein [Dyadobacter sediminis]|uniref:Outer membrane protein beta-barrel domain-containing protein n=1 Tax=Dyadobacter sediminis TaxID=1493691 RepID=A0A5R9KAT1_9BACT|nr:hypothetical protein [Dyadobacter sediminis]TLU91888.1 hypothetical protein FEM55_14040 [Dyadobacter sediminis]GGB99438.1 hypothetical protein GCM10011325_28280 [Dyadobacter sediminis]